MAMPGAGEPHSAAHDAALTNVLGAIALTLSERLLGPQGLGSLRPPLDHLSASAALSLVRWMPGVPMPALADYLELSQPATVRVVQRLRARGLLATRRTPGDRRVLLYLTDAGAAEIEAV